jgi:hypothetical protein
MRPHLPAQRNDVGFQRVAAMGGQSRRTGPVAHDPKRTRRVAERRDHYRTRHAGDWVDRRLSDAACGCSRFDPDQYKVDKLVYITKTCKRGAACFELNEADMRAQAVTIKCRQQVA